MKFNLHIPIVLLIVIIFHLGTIDARHGGTRFSTENNCVGDHCNYIAIGIVCGIVIIFGLIMLFACFKHRESFYKRFKCCNCFKKLPKSNSSFIEKTKQSDAQEFLFRNGLWNLRYRNYALWQGPYTINLQISSQLKTVTGSGTDSTGNFDINGVYSDKTQQMDLILKYQDKESNVSVISHRTMTIQVSWNTQEKKFKGSYYDNQLSNECELISDFEIEQKNLD